MVLEETLAQGDKKVLREKVKHLASKAKKYLKESSPEALVL